MDQNNIKQEYKLLRDQIELLKLFIYNSKVIDENNPHYKNLITKMYELENMIHLAYNFESNFEDMEQEHKQKPNVYYEKTYCSYCKHDLIYHSDHSQNCSYTKDTIKCNCFISYKDVLEVHHITVKVDEKGNEIE